MSGRFACPECGGPIAVAGAHPGREVICPGCSTLVEVPFLPREAPRRRPRGGRGSWRRGRWSRAARRRFAWGLALGSAAGVALATWWAVGRIDQGARSGQERVLAELVAASDRAAAAHDPGGAFREIEAAVSRARRIDPGGSARVDALVARRDAAARAEVAARLAALDRLDLDRRVGEARILAERARRDPALAGLAAEAEAQVEGAATCQAEADLARARTALDRGAAAEAFAAAARAAERGGRLSAPGDAGRLRDAAGAVVVAAVTRAGVLPAGCEGATPGSIAALARPIWARALEARGYLLPPPGSPWGEAWAAHAPFRADVVRLDESPGDLYQHSQNRSTVIDGLFRLSRGGRTAWEARVYATTRSPLPDLPAYVAGRLATGDRRDPEAERRLRDDARAAFRAAAERQFRGIPTAESPPGGT